MKTERERADYLRGQICRIWSMTGDRQHEIWKACSEALNHDDALIGSAPVLAGEASGSVGQEQSVEQKLTNQSPSSSSVAVPQTVEQARAKALARMKCPGMTLGAASDRADEATIDALIEAVRLSVLALLASEVKLERELNDAINERLAVRATNQQLREALSALGEASGGPGRSAAPKAR